MSEKKKSIADTSFIIDWSKYDKNGLLFEYYNIVYITESVLNEIKTELPLLWISSYLIEGKIKILEETAEIRHKALRIVEMTRTLPVRSCDYPESVCLVHGKELGIHVLTENGGVFVAKDILDEFKDVQVLRGIDILYNLTLLGKISDFKEEVMKYMNITKHKYTKDILSKYGIKIQ